MDKTIEDLKQVNQVKCSIIKTQNERFCDQIKEIEALRERNRKLEDIAWHYFLLAKMFRGLLGGG